MTFTSFYLVYNCGLQDMTTKDCLKKLQEDASKLRMVIITDKIIYLPFISKVNLRLLSLKRVLLFL